MPAVPPEKTQTIRDTVHGDRSSEHHPGIVLLFSEAPIPGDGVYAARPELTVGRSPDCGIFVDDSGLSRTHAAITFNGTRATVRDLGSHNGTLVNGRRVDEAGIGAEDVVRCGQTLLKLVEDIRPFDGWRRWGLAGPLVGGPTMRALLEEIAAFASTNLEVLITGETGTGKELVAREIHRLSGRNGPFVPVNCAAIPESLFEAELFGAVRGAFTGADADRPGLFQSAAGGTLFLDEVGELPQAMQPKLLRAVEQREARPVGAGKPDRVDVRLVAATNCELATDVERGSFRADLYHRLRGAHITIPALRHRIEDIPLAVQHLLASNGDGVVASAAVVQHLLLHSWTGNFRELDRVLREATARASATGEKRLLPRHLRTDLVQEQPAAPDVFEKIRDALTRNRGNVSHAAAELGMHRAQVYAILRERGLKADSFR